MRQAVIRRAMNPATWAAAALVNVATAALDPDWFPALLLELFLLGLTLALRHHEPVTR